jgi:hypothetical protein
MRKYTALGIVVAAVVCILFLLAANQESQADLSAFSGTVENGRTVVAMKGETYYWATYGDNWYNINIPESDTGWYCVTDGCQHISRYWDGMMGQFVNFNVPQNGPCN